MDEQFQEEEDLRGLQQQMMQEYEEWYFYNQPEYNQYLDKEPENELSNNRSIKRL